jgi:hypothetical protein
MAYDTNITPGRPPLLWSDVKDAFDKVNANFEILQATIGDGSGLTPLDFTTLDSSVVPVNTNQYTLGSITKKWKNVYAEAWSAEFGEELNGLWAGNSQIKGKTDSSLRYIIDLPAGSTVDDQLIIDPSKTFFQSVQVDNELRIEATGDGIVKPFGDTLNLISGDSIELIVDSSAESITFNNMGVTELNGTTGQIGVSGTTGNITLTNLGVLSLTSTTALPSGRTAGAGINISASTGSGIRVTNTGVLSVEAGNAFLTVSTDAATGIVTITNSAPAGNAFRYVTVNSGSTLEANSVNGLLNFVNGPGITLTAAEILGLDTVRISVDPVFDLKGSVFGDNSTKIVDAVENKVYGGIFATTLRTEETKIALGDNAGLTSQGAQAVAIGRLAGQTSQGASSVAIGVIAGQTLQGEASVAIGGNAGVTNQGASAVAVGANAGTISQGAWSTAIGANAGNTSQHANTIIINAGSVATNSNGTDRFFVNPIRNVTGANGVVQYDATTKEVSYSSALGTVSGTLSGTFTGNIFTNLIDSADSSAITVTPATIFSSDVTVENDLRVNNQILVRGSKIVLLTDLKSIVAASTSFADFQLRIAALV